MVAAALDDYGGTLPQFRGVRVRFQLLQRTSQRPLTQMSCAGPASPDVLRRSCAGPAQVLRDDQVADRRAVVNQRSISGIVTARLPQIAASRRDSKGDARRDSRRDSEEGFRGGIPRGIPRRDSEGDPRRDSRSPSEKPSEEPNTPLGNSVPRGAPSRGSHRVVAVGRAHGGVARFPPLRAKRTQSSIPGRKFKLHMSFCTASTRAHQARARPNATFFAAGSGPDDCAASGQASHFVHGLGGVRCPRAVPPRLRTDATRAPRATSDGSWRSTRHHRRHGESI